MNSDEERSFWARAWNAVPYVGFGIIAVLLVVVLVLAGAAVGRPSACEAYYQAAVAEMEGARGPLAVASGPANRQARATIALAYLRLYEVCGRR